MVTFDLSMAARGTCRRWAIGHDLFTGLFKNTVRNKAHCYAECSCGEMGDTPSALIIARAVSARQAAMTSLCGAESCRFRGTQIETREADLQVSHCNGIVYKAINACVVCLFSQRRYIPHVYEHKNDPCYNSLVSMAQGP